jgi:beta-glucosidase
MKFNFFVPFALLGVALTGVIAVMGQEQAPKYRNPNLAIEDRVADLLSRMTLEEKVHELMGGSEGQAEVIDPTGTFTTEQARAAFAQWDSPDYALTPRRSAILRNGVQRYLREKTRLGIPSLFMGESLHGFMEYHSTSFPQALGLASTWDPELVQAGIHGGGR